MSAAGIIAHCLTPSSPPQVSRLVWWAAGDGIVQKVQSTGSFAQDYSIGGADISQVITADDARQRVFVPTSAGVYVFEGFDADAPIPAPTLVAVDWMGTYGSQVWNNAISLDQASGQVFLAGATNDNVSIIDTDNSVVVVSGITDAFYVRALGSGKFACISEGTHVKVYGPSNAYAAPLVDDTAPDTVLAIAYDPAEDQIICILETYASGLWIVDASTGASGAVAVDGIESSIMYWNGDTSTVVINQEGDNGKLWVYDPHTGTQIASIDYTAEQPGSVLSGPALDMKHIDNSLAVLQRWTLLGDQYICVHICDLTTGAVLSTYAVPDDGLGQPSNIAFDYDTGLFAVAHAGNDRVYEIYYDAPYTVTERVLADTGSNTVARTNSLGT